MNKKRKVNESPLISILTPSFNKVDFIAKAIESVIFQKYPNVEHIIIDGCSTDGSVEVIKEFARKYKHLKVVVEKDDSHIEALNKAVKMAKGEIISVLNTDDYYEPNVFFEVANLFRSNEEVEVVVGNCRMVDSNGDTIRISKPVVDLVRILQPWWYEFPINPDTYFYKNVHDKIGLFDPKYGLEFDYEFFIRLAMKCNILYVDKLFGNFRFYYDSKTYLNRRNTMINLYKICFKFHHKLNTLTFYYVRFFYYIYFSVRVLKQRMNL